ncbi:F0F1 ATP synthase subunit delta [Alkalihalobacterium chitinilyticum]|uniref:ATP synthase subunit delta n=1 Tax=Alkalihalobacterium chitinilyticum TaxID=2980103 RepID=A0ABT5VGY7_9BACI|nr:F0F1 ATP synthase subunit delta [Alkalihalobacterium chitinilyticum]MDE5414699.1 F0F1 ATP synthase subunit delta [Alkalihalobacterium chitinilyticum]
MGNKAVANRYAVALFQLAKEKDILKQIGEDLQLVKAVFEQTERLSNVLEHPKVLEEQKVKLIKDSFADAVSAYVLNTLLIMVKQKKGNLVIPFINKYQELAYEAQGVAVAKVYTVKALSEEDKQQVSTTFAKKVGVETLHIENIIDPELIGGMKIRIGDRIYDGSIKRQLDRLQRTLVAGNR